MAAHCDKRKQLLKVLIVEDDFEIRESIKAEVSKFLGDDLSVVEANDGVEGLLHSSLEKFDVIFTDFNMPGLNGLELLEEVKGEACVNRLTPVIFLSAMKPELKGSPGVFENVYFIEKPWKTRHLKFIFNCCLKTRNDAA